MYYQVSKEFFDKLPNACFGAVAVRGLDNTRDIPELEQMLAENVAACETYFAGKKPKETEDILPYRAAFTALGINPNKFLCSIEALLTRIAKGKGFPHINAAVDLGNAVSIKHRLPMGAHDLGTIEEGLDVRLAREGDTFIPFGSTAQHQTRTEQYIFFCIICMHPDGPAGFLHIFQEITMRGNVQDGDLPGCFKINFCGILLNELRHLVTG